MKETETFHVHVTARVCASTCAGIDFRLMVRVLETSGVRKKSNIKEDLIPLEKWGGIIERLRL